MLNLFYKKIFLVIRQLEIYVLCLQVTSGNESSLWSLYQKHCRKILGCFKFYTTIKLKLNTTKTKEAEISQRKKSKAKLWWNMNYGEVHVNKFNKTEYKIGSIKRNGYAIKVDSIWFTSCCFNKRTWTKIYYNYVYILSFLFRYRIQCRKIFMLIQKINISNLVFEKFCNWQFDLQYQLECCKNECYLSVIYNARKVLFHFEERLLLSETEIINKIIIYKFGCKQLLCISERSRIFLYYIHKYHLHFIGDHFFRLLLEANIRCDNLISWCMISKHFLQNNDKLQ